MRGTVLHFSPFWHSASVVYLLKIFTVCVLFRYCYTVWCSSVVVVSTDDDRGVSDFPRARYQRYHSSGESCRPKFNRRVVLEDIYRWARIAMLQLI